MLRRPLFWIVFIAVSFAAAVFTFRNFSTAFPLVSIDLRMDRAEALRSARTLADKNAWPSKGFDEAAQFSADQEVQNFIELEGGGKPELGRILKEKIFAPYTWRVRQYKEGDAHETLVRFTPDGDPHGFRVKLPDQEKGESIPADEAQHLAEGVANADWKIDFARYQLVESSKEVRPGGRTDHTFVYERQDERVREGRYRLRLVIGGDRLIELTQFVQIPEAFKRRYEQMRSANDVINVADSVVVLGLYLLGFCGLGLFFMIRQRWVIWRPAVFWGLLIGLLIGLQQLNEWPLAWMNYDTAVSASGFAVRQVMTALGLFGLIAILLSISFMAAETLTRRAFPNQLQLWKIWSRPVSSSRTVLGQTWIGYLLVAPFFAYEIVLYFFAQGKLGWWTPSDTLVNPDMFAHYLPSLSAIANAAQAGFWEECLFRAVPLATAALIGDRFGKRRLFIGVAMVLQALVFGAGHAGYVNQPAYARIVELIIPSFAFGALYLMFGLLPGIVLHFTYDTVWMALPLFVSSGTRAHIEQAIVLLAVLVPLWVVIANRARFSKTWRDAPEDALNRAWTPHETVEAAPPVEKSAAAATSIPQIVSRALPIAGLAGLIVWILASAFHTDAPAIEIDRGEAEREARAALSRQGVELDSRWTVLSHVEGQPGEMNRFVWQTAGRARYEKLLGIYVTPPIWVVRFARFQGDVAERAEEYQVYIRGDGGIFRVYHQLAEATPGVSLNEQQGRALAVSALPDSSNFKEVSSQAAKRPARTDWTFVFKDTRDYGLPQGEARISVEISGDKVTDQTRYVYVPEDWSRNEKNRRNLPSTLSIVCTVILAALVLAGAVVGAIRWSRKRPFSRRTFLAVSSAVFLISVVNVINNWPVIASQASTAQPLALQAGAAVVITIVVGIFTGLGVGLAAGLVAPKVNGAKGLSAGLPIGVSVAFVLAGTGALARHAAAAASPLWGNLGPASAWAPLLASTLGPAQVFFIQVVVMLLVLYAVRGKPHAAWIWLLVGIVLGGSSSIETIPAWLILGVTTGVALMLAYVLIFRHQPQLILVTVATLVMLGAVRDAIQRMFPNALTGSLAGAVLVAAAAWLWFRGSMESQPRTGG